MYAQKIHSDRAELCQQAANALIEVAQQAVTRYGNSNIVLTGGGTGTGIVGALKTSEKVAEVDWSKVHIWFGDERFLPVDDPERNALQARNAGLTWLMTEHGLPAQNIHEFPATTQEGENPLSLDEAARVYAQQLKQAAVAEGTKGDVPRFDVVLLGVGPDAHVASLFPGLPGPKITGETVIGVTDSPKPPPERVSLTVEAINTSAFVWFVVAGADKADAVEQIQHAQQKGHTDAELLPATLVKGIQGTTWWLDEAAAR